MAENDNTKALMAGLFGLVLGLGAGILLSPKSGEDIRKEVKDKADEAKSTADTIAERAKKKWREFREESRRDIKAASKKREMADERADLQDFGV